MSHTAAVCKHCGSPSYGQDEFCCGGCEAAWGMIHKLGLEDFYSRKAGVVTSKVGEQPLILEEYFADCVSVSDDGLSTAVFYITSVRCAACVWLVENVVKKIGGVQDIRVNYATFRTKLIYDSSKVSLKHILEQIAAVGNPPVPNNPVHNDSEKRELFLRFGIGAFFTIQLMLYSIALYAGYFTDMPPSFKRVMQFISWALATPVVFYTGAPFFKNSIRALKQRHMSMDVLVALGAGSAYLYSIAAIFLGYEIYFDTCATILTLITLGRYIELTSKQRSRGSMLSLFSLAPPFARLLTGGSIAVVPLAKVREGDRLQILPGDKLPVDGTVFSGSSEVDESMLTGEPIPKGKQKGSKVFAGTLNTAGTLVVTVDAVKGTVLAQIIEAIESADVSKTKLIKIVDRIVSVFVPVVIVISLSTFAGRFFILDNSFAQAMMHSVAVLVVACPCAMGLAVPLAVTTAIGNAASFGAVIKNGDLLGALQEINRICFDKTGTLTAGAPEIIKYNTTDERFLVYSASVESYSNHILARTVAQYTPERVPVSDIHEEAGHGVSGIVEGHCVKVGRRDFVSGQASALDKELQRDIAGGYSLVCVGIDGELTGYYVLSDPLRADSVSVVQDLSKGYKISLLSGDTPAMVSQIAGELGVDYQAALSPFDKADILKMHQEDGEKVLMVGDGINDAPALKQADASVAVGKNAADIAIDSADAVLIRQDITLIKHLLRLSRRTNRIIKENLGWSFIYNIIAIPLAVIGIIHPVASAVFMSVSSVVVVLNSTRAKLKV